MVLRFSIAAILAASITAALFFGMLVLIATGGDINMDKKERKIIDFVQVKTDAQVIKKERTPPKKPQQPDAAPPDMPPPEFDNTDTANIGGSLDLGSIAMEASMDIGGFALGPMEEDAEYLPIVKVNPQYPREAARRGIEGYVVVSYTVTTTGTVKDVKVVEASPANVFERSAIAAAMRFKYKPKLMDGNAVEVPNVTNKFNFTLSKK